MEYCTNCGERVNQASSFCTNCGFVIKEAEKSNVHPPSPQSEPSRSSQKGKNKTNGILIGLIAVLSVILIAGATYLITKALTSKKETQVEVAANNPAVLKQEKGKSQEGNTAQSTKPIEKNNESEQSSVRKDSGIENNSLLSYIQRFEEIPVVDQGQTYYLGKWNVEVENGVIHISANEIPRDSLQKIFSLYDSKRFEPLKQWAMEVYAAAEEIADLNHTSYVVRVGNECTGQYPRTLPNSLLINYSGSCGYSIPVLNGTNKADFTLVLTQLVFSSSTSPKASSDYIIPDSDIRVLSGADIDYLTRGELRLARNEIYARHGYVFQSDDLREYFSKKAWYTPNYSYNGSLNNIERHNVDLIKAREESLN